MRDGTSRICRACSSLIFFNIPTSELYLAGSEICDEDRVREPNMSGILEKCLRRFITESLCISAKQQIEIIVSEFTFRTPNIVKQQIRQPTHETASKPFTQCINPPPITIQGSIPPELPKASRIHSTLHIQAMSRSQKHIFESDFRITHYPGHLPPSSQDQTRAEIRYSRIPQSARLHSKALLLRRCDFLGQAFEDHLDQSRWHGSLECGS